MLNLDISILSYKLEVFETSIFSFSCSIQSIIYRRSRIWCICDLFYITCCGRDAQYIILYADVFRDVIFSGNVLYSLRQSHEAYWRFVKI
jgi:hypothetical protein